MVAVHVDRAHDQRIGVAIHDPRASEASGALSSAGGREQPRQHDARREHLLRQRTRRARAAAGSRPRPPAPPRPPRRAWRRSAARRSPAVALDTGRLDDAGTAARQVADRAVADPSRARLHVRRLGGAHLAARRLHVAPELRRASPRPPPDRPDASRAAPAGRGPRSRRHAGWRRSRASIPARPGSGMQRQEARALVAVVGVAVEEGVVVVPPLRHRGVARARPPAAPARGQDGEMHGRPHARPRHAVERDRRVGRAQVHADGEIRVVAADAQVPLAGPELERAGIDVEQRGAREARAQRRVQAVGEVQQQARRGDAPANAASSSPRYSTRPGGPSRPLSGRWSSTTRSATPSASA